MIAPGTDVRERVTGRAGVVTVGGTGVCEVLFPCLRGNLNLDGTVDSGRRAIPEELLEPYKPDAELVAKATANVLQAEG